MLDFTLFLTGLLLGGVIGVVSMSLVRINRLQEHDFCRMYDMIKLSDKLYRCVASSHTGGGVG